jgi:hypothetical protein
MVSDVLHSWWAWAEANRLVLLTVIVWVIANVAPRPHPDDTSGWKKTFWMVIDRLCVLTAEELPGRLKWLLAPSRRYEEKEN